MLDLDLLDFDGLIRQEPPVLPHPRLAERMGDLVLIAQDDAYLWWADKENLMLGRHNFLKTGLFRGAFLWGKRSFAGKEEIAHRRKVEEIIDLLELQSVRNKFVGALPYGTQKQVELGRALALEPELLLLDEHTAALDPKTAQRVIELTEKIVRENHLTTIMVTHNMQQAIRYGNRMIMLHEGKVKFDIQGDEKRALTVEEVVKRFGADLKDEALLCA